MASDWDEVKRLAADFQRAQLSSTIQRLSERNCIEIVKKLLELKLVDVIFTTDGKEYVTPQHLLKEIQDELIVHGGRINLVDLARILGLDLSHIEAKASELSKSETNLRLVLGQLIDDTYLDSVAEEINDKLQQTGQITIAELTKYYDLPGDFLEETVHKRLGTSIQGQADPFDSRTIFTEAYVARHKAIVRGVLSAVTRPTSVSTLINNYKIPERLFYSILDDLIKTGWLAGSISGGRSERASYVPDIYAKSQNEWVDSFYKQNGYLEYDSLIRLGISEPKPYLSKRYKDTFTFLNSCCIGKSILEQAEAAIDEAVNTSSWTDIMPLLPSVLNVEDVQQIIHVILKSNPKYNTSCHVFCKTLVVSEAFIQECFNMFDPIMTAKAEEDAQKGAHLFVASQQKATGMKTEKSDEHTGKGKQDKKEERRKKGGKSGGGTQGRETKIRSTKKKYHTGKGDDESDSEGEEGMFPGSRGGKQAELEFLSPDEIEKQLSEVITMQECPDEMINELATHLYRPLTKKYQELAKSVFLASTVASSATRRKTHAETQEKLNNMACQVHMFEKGAKLFAEDIQSQLIKYLLRSLCTEMTNMILNYLCTEHGIHTDSEMSTLTPEARQKIIAKLPSDMKDSVMKLHNSLSSKTLEEFFKELDTVMGPNICDMVMKKIDKKRERQAAFEYRRVLLNQLSEATDSALCLHLAVLIFILAQTQQMVHASGKFVPQMISLLQKQAPSNIYQLLYEYQDLVMRQLNTQLESEEKSDIISKLEELKPKLKEMATTYKKTSQSSSET